MGSLILPSPVWATVAQQLLSCTFLLERLLILITSMAQTPNDAINHWYEFLYDGETGAKINGNVITLYFVDGKRGDDDLLANGILSLTLVLQL